jgi:signal transduction histidine kinase
MMGEVGWLLGALQARVVVVDGEGRATHVTAGFDAAFGRLDIDAALSEQLEPRHMELVGQDPIEGMPCLVRGTPARMRRTPLRGASRQLVGAVLEFEPAPFLALGAMCAPLGHELRTPLNAILGFAELLRDGPSAVSAPLQREYLGHIEAGGRALLQLIDDVLAGSRQEIPAAVRLGSLEVLTQEIIDLAAPRARRAGVPVTRGEIERAAPIPDDPGLKIVLYRLLLRTIELTSPGGELVLCGGGADGAYLEFVGEAFQDQLGHALADSEAGPIEARGARVQLEPQRRALRVVLPRAPA